MKTYLRVFTISLFAVIPPFAHAQEVGTLSVFLFKDGKPLVGNEITIDNEQHIYSDADGSAQITLTVGKHQVEIFGKNKRGENLGYFKKPFVIKQEKDTQVIASFTKVNDETTTWGEEHVVSASSGISIDTPLGEMNNKKKAKELKAKGEGTLNGTVITSDKKTPIEGARVFVKGTSIDTRTDASGNFSVKIPANSKVSISVVHSAYSAQTLNDINVEKDGTVSRSVELTPASLELEEFVVLAPKVEGSIADIMAEEKETSAISNILGSEEFAKKGDSNAAAALKRVTGITLIGGKNIYVRGLGERYSNIEMNSMPIPSPDPTKRTVPLDIFPSAVIGSLKVQKSGSADIPSSFGGGYIDIRTKDSAGEDYIKMSLGLNGNTQTGSDSITYEGSSSDFLAYDDGYRDISSNIINHADVKVGERVGVFSVNEFSKEELMQMSRDFSDRIYEIENEKLPVGGSFGIEGLKNIDITDDHKVTLFANYGYGQKHTYREEEFYKYKYDADGNPLAEPNSFGENKKASSSYSHQAMFNAGYSFLDLLKVKYTKLFTHVGEKNTRITEGEFGSNDDHLIYHYLDWDERTLNADQITAQFDYELLNLKNSFDMGMEHVTATLKQPNNFFYADKVRDDGDKVIMSGSTNFLSKKLNSQDEVFAFYLKNKTEYEIFSDEDYLETGINYSSKKRNSEYQKFYLKNSGAEVDQYSIAGGDIEATLDKYVRGDVDYANRAFLVSGLFDPADYFDADVDEASLYMNSFVKPREDIDVTFGMRYVNLTQSVDQYQEDNNRKIEKVRESLDVSDVFPSASLKYRYDKDNHFDVALSKTYIIPDLREFTSGSYFHPYDVATVQGNPELENTNIYSFDLKYSHYYSDSENIKAGLFFKYLDKPIEDIMIESSSLPIYSYANSDSAMMYGFEIDGRKKLDFINPKLENYYLSGNFSYTDSDVTLRAEQEETYTTNHRQLQGLSQIVMNATVGYETDDRTVTLSYNKMGERIRKVGLAKSGTVLKYPDNIEVPPQLLDFVWSEKLENDISAKVKVGNILDDETIWKQGSRVIQRFKRGQTISFGVSKKF